MVLSALSHIPPVFFVDSEGNITSFASDPPPIFLFSDESYFEATYQGELKNNVYLISATCLLNNIMFTTQS